MWITAGIITYILFWLICIVSYTVHYLTEVIQVTSFSQILYTMNAGAEGAEGTIGTAVAGFFQSYWLLLVLGTAVLAAYIYVCVKRAKLKKTGIALFPDKKWNAAFNGSSIVALCLASVMLLTGFTSGLEEVGYSEFKENVNRVSDLYEENYVEPAQTTITFPEKKRNLIHIVMESMESTFTCRENGGGYKEDLIPNLYVRSQEGQSFAANGDTTINGAYVTNNSGWTVAGLVAQSAAVPLNVGNAVFTSNLDKDMVFMPHLRTLGDILEDEGYNNYFMCGSDGQYAGRANYYKQHGNYTILDYEEAAKEKAIPEGYRVWWGFEDQKLYPWAQKTLTEISSKDEPFNFTLLTVDTHFTDGYKCEQCEDEFDTQYKNVISCSDRQMNEFIDWIQQQDFYEDTTIVISGDHLSMDGSVAQNIPGGYDRKAYFTVLNGPEYTTDTSREYCTLDIFPTIVEAMGAKIDGGKLGLGTSLYSGEETLIERMGLRQLNAELTAASDYYNDVIMSGDETDPDKKKEPAKEMIEQPDGEQYEENRDNFSDPNYTWTAPAVPYYPTYTPPVTPTPEDPEQPGTPIGSDPGTNGGGSQTPVPPTSQTPTPEPPVSTDPLPDPPVSTVPDPQPPVDPTPEPPVTPDPGPSDPGAIDPGTTPPADAGGTPSAPAAVPDAGAGAQEAPAASAVQ